MGKNEPFLVFLNRKREESFIERFSKPPPPPWENKDGTNNWEIAQLFENAPSREEVKDE